MIVWKQIAFNKKKEKLDFLFKFFCDLKKYVFLRTTLKQRATNRH